MYYRRMGMAQQAIHKFILGNKEVEGKTAEFEYDRGWYTISEVAGEQREVIYRSKNAQEAYMKWNVYIGRKKERQVSEEPHRQEGNERRHSGRNSRQENHARHEGHFRADSNKEGHSRQENHGSREGWDRRENNPNRRRRHDNR